MDIQFPQSDDLILDDCRRLTGPSLVWKNTGAILDVLIENEDMDVVLDSWYRHLNRVLGKIDWQQHACTHRGFENGFSFLIAAPLDQLYSATLVLETAWYLTSCEVLGIEVEPLQRLIDAILESIDSEANPAMLALQQAAEENAVDFLYDDEAVSVGHGEGSLCWPVEQIPPESMIALRSKFTINAFVVLPIRAKLFISMVSRNR